MGPACLAGGWWLEAICHCADRACNRAPAPLNAEAPQDEDEGLSKTADRLQKTEGEGLRGPKTSYLTPNANPKSNPNADAGTGTGGVQGRVIGD